MKRRSVMVTVPAFVLAMISLIALSAITPPAAAIDTGTATPVTAPQTSTQDDAVESVEPGESLGVFQQGDVQWTVNRNDFTSMYPDGFEFVLDVQSSGGTIVSAKVAWQHRPHIRARQPIRVRRETGEIDAETGVISASWTPTGGSNVPPWVAVHYSWTLRDEAGNIFETERVMVEYADDTRPWIRLETDDALVFSEGLPASVGEMVGEALAEGRQKYLDGWGGRTLPYKPRVLLFHDFDTFNEWQVDNYDTTSMGYVSVGVTSDVWGGTAQVLYGSAESLAYETVLHEVEHMHQYEYLYPGRTKMTPGWFIEGDARFYEALDNSFDANLVTDLARNGNLPTLLQGTGPSIGGEDSLRGYAMGYMFWKWLTDRWGLEVHSELMALLNDDLALNDALETVTGLDPISLETEWRIWLGARDPVPATLIPTPTMLPFLNTPTPYGQ